MLQGAVMVLQAVAASTSSTLQQLQLLGCGLTDTAFIHSAIQQRAADALAQAKTPKKKKKAKKKGAKGKEPAGELTGPYSPSHAKTSLTSTGSRTVTVCMEVAARPLYV